MSVFGPPDQSSEVALEVVGLQKRFVTDKTVVDAVVDVNFQLRRGEALTLIGPSGCGKSTLIRILAGLDTDFMGTVSWPSLAQHGHERSAMVFQADALMPWLTLEQNVELPLRSQMKRDERRERAAEYLELVGLADSGRRYPNQVSGGMRQRANIARALAVRPSVLLMDEPLAAVDAQTRVLMQEELRRIWARANATVIYITHDVNEALLLGDRLFVMTGRPATIRHRYDLAFRGSQRPITELRVDAEVLGLVQTIWTQLDPSTGSSTSSLTDTK